VQVADYNSSRRKTGTRGKWSIPHQDQFLENKELSQKERAFWSARRLSHCTEQSVWRGVKSNTGCSHSTTAASKSVHEIVPWEDGGWG
jgi:hypothetical protein